MFRRAWTALRSHSEAAAVRGLLVGAEPPDDHRRCGDIVPTRRAAAHVDHRNGRDPQQRLRDTAGRPPTYPRPQRHHLRGIDTAGQTRRRRTASQRRTNLRPHSVSASVVGGTARGAHGWAPGRRDDPRRDTVAGRDPLLERRRISSGRRASIEVRRDRYLKSFAPSNGRSCRAAFTLGASSLHSTARSVSRPGR